LKNSCLCLLLLFCALLHAQDTVYFLDGSSKTGKVLEVRVDFVRLRSLNGTDSLDKSNVMLIEYQDGRIEKYHLPEKEAIYQPNDNGQPATLKHPQHDLFPQNYVSINTLAFVNSDVSAFLEHVSSNRKIGFGAMAAYNFNTRASLSNLHVFVLENGKKDYDLGAFVNFYKGKGMTEHTSVYYGVMIKYMKIHFTSLTIDSVKVGNAIAPTNHYTPSSGSQLATIFTFGTHTPITHNFFIKTVVGLGGFILRGDYKKQYNYEMNKGVNVGSQFDRSLLLKMYLGINAGLTF